RPGSPAPTSPAPAARQQPGRRNGTSGRSLRGRPGSWGWIEQPFAPGLRTAEERASVRSRDPRRIGGPDPELLLQPGVDLAELGPALERPAGLKADARERTLGPDHVAVARGVAIALAVADEHDRTAGGLVGQHPVALARAADEARGMAVRVR